METKTILEQSKELIYGFAVVFDQMTRLLQRYFENGEIALFDARRIAESCALVEKSESIEMTLYTYIKNGGDKKPVDALKSSIGHFFEVIEKYVEYGNEYKSFDLPTIFDTLLTKIVVEKMKVIERRSQKMQSDCDWLNDHIQMVDIKNDDNYELDEIDDIEQEHGFRVNRLFDNCDHIERIAAFLAEQREAHALCWKYGLHSLIELATTIEIRIERYSDERSTAEFVKDKYRKAVEAGELIIESDYELREWECEDIQTREEVTSIIADSEEKRSILERGADNSNMPQREYFSILHVKHLHDICNGNQFDEVSIGEMYSIINLHECHKTMVCRDGEKERVCHLIYVLGERIPSEYRLKWRKAICERLNIEYRTYNKKYKHVSVSNASRFNQAFEEKIDEMLDLYQKLDDAA